MKGKVVVITGATSGIGEIAAQRLAAMGARIALVARNAARGQKTLSRLPSLGAGAAHSIHYGELSRIADCKRVAAEISAAEPRVDVLINNAGALFGSRHVTSDNLEETFATNHMAYFVLTMGLQASLRAAVSARVVCTASDAHKGYTSRTCSPRSSPRAGCPRPTRLLVSPVGSVRPRLTTSPALHFRSTEDGPHSERAARYAPAERPCSLIL